MSKYLQIREVPNPDKKTRRWQVHNMQGAILGEIFFFAHWRKYVFAPGDSIFDLNCLTEITDFMTAHAKDRQPTEGN